MPSRRQALLWTVLALAASVGAAAFTRGGPGNLSLQLWGVGGTRLAFAATTHEFGIVFASETVDAEFPFTNPSPDPIRITDVATGCGCLSASASPRFVGAGASGVVRAKLVTSGRYGPHAVHLRVRTDEGPRRGALLTLRGTVRAVLRPRPPRLFLEVAPGARRTERIQVDVLTPIEGLALDVEGDGMAAAVEGRDDSGFTLAIALTAPARAGTRLAGVELRYREAATGRALTTWIPLVLVVRES